MGQASWWEQYSPLLWHLQCLLHLNSIFVWICDGGLSSPTSFNVFYVFGSLFQLAHFFCGIHLPPGPGKGENEKFRNWSTGGISCELVLAVYAAEIGIPDLISFILQSTRGKEALLKICPCSTGHGACVHGRSAPGTQHPIHSCLSRVSHGQEFKVTFKSCCTWQPYDIMKKQNDQV